MPKNKRKRAQKGERPVTNAQPAPAGLYVKPSWRDAVCLLVALLMYVTVARGLLYYAPLIQLLALVGAVAGLTAAARVNAAAVAFAASTMGLLVLQPFVIARGVGDTAFAQSAMVAFGSAAVAWVVRWAVETYGTKVTTIVPWIIVGLLTVNLWATVITLDARIVTEDGRSGADMLGENPVVGQQWSDEDFYRRVLWLMTQEDAGFYEAFRQGYQENIRWQRDPNTVLAVRLPTAFLLWNYLPGKPWSLIVGYLALVSAAGGAIAWMSARRTSLTLGIPAIAALYGLALSVSTSRLVLMTEAWAVPFAVVSVCAAIVSFGQDRWKALTVLSVVAAVAAAGLRELMVYLFVAGIAAALVGPPERRTFRAVMWLVGFTVVLAGYVVHAGAAAAIVTNTGGVSQWFNGGPSNLVAGLGYAAEYIGGTALVPATFGVLALSGAAASNLTEERVFAGLCCALPLLSFLFVGSDAVDVAKGTAINYWGMIVVPVLFAVSPLGIERLLTWADRPHA
ncbi:MAG: hypothetical protein U1E26_05945 [Coriobacteriia bacterium]|nr:hypothetical protein [Coriobacteriia bacterium]